MYDTARSQRDEIMGIRPRRTAFSILRMLVRGCVTTSRAESVEGGGKRSADKAVSERLGDMLESFGADRGSHGCFDAHCICTSCLEFIDSYAWLN